MPRKIDWESQIGRRLRLRDLHVFVTVVQCSSMAKAAAALGVSQPAVSEVIADLEGSLGVRLLDRGPHGVEATMYGRALLKGGTAAFDELKQCIKQIEFLGDRQVGELRIGCPESFAASVLPPVIHRFSMRYPNVTLSVNESPAAHWPGLRDRRLDLVIERLARPLGKEADDLKVEVLFNDEVAIAAGPDSRWVGRNKIDIRELVDEPWILLPSNSWNYATVAQAYREAQLPPPKVETLDLLDPSARQPARQQSLPHGVSALRAGRGRRPLSGHHPAGRPAAAAAPLAGGGGDAEESYLEPGGRRLRRAPARLRELHGV